MVSFRTSSHPSVTAWQIDNELESNFCFCDAMIDALYNYRQGDIHSTEFSDEFNKLCIPFENSLSEEQIDTKSSTA